MGVGEGSDDEETVEEVDGYTVRGVDVFCPSGIWLLIVSVNVCWMCLVLQGIPNCAHSAICSKDDDGRKRGF